MSSTARISDTGRKGDLRIGFGFERINNVPQACMYLYAVRSPRQVAMVPLRLMYLFDERERDPVTKEPRCMPEVRRVAEAIYGAMPTTFEVTRVLDAITEFMTDLKNMPPPSTFRDPSQLERALELRGYDMVR
jgi:hypothetical protein